MDYRAFFDEIAMAHAKRGLEFHYTYEGFYYGCPKPNKFILGQFAKDFFYESLPAKAYGSDSFPKALPNPWCYSKPNKKAPWYAWDIDKAQKARLFRDPPDMVYTLAWELSQKIGRLPDALHARMALSADDHPCIGRYFASWGA